MPTMEQRRKKLMEECRQPESNQRGGGIAAVTPPSTPSKPFPPTQLSASRPISSIPLRLDIPAKSCDDRPTSPVRTLSNPSHDDARAPDERKPESGSDLPVDGASSFEFPTKMPLASTKGWSLDFLIARAPRTFHHADRVSAALAPEELAKKIEEYEENGKPLVIEGFHKLPNWPKKKFTLESFIKDAEEDTIKARNVHTWTDRELKLTEFIKKSRAMGPYAHEDETERWYGKDMECPKSWEDWLKKGKAVPISLLGNGPQDKFRYRPESAQVQTLMCYLGIGDTFTPCHKDLCASSGQNLMCYTEKDGSSFWFMTESSVAPKASQYFQKLRHELDHENHIITLNELAKAPFKVYILEQKLGDLVLVPQRSCHQVVNAGGITIKTSWSRMTSKGLKTAYFHELPIYRRVCRPEIYKVKSTIFCTMIREAEELQKLMNASPRKPSTATTSKAKNGRGVHTSRNNTSDAFANALADDIKELISVFDCILAEEYDKINKNMPQMFPGTKRSEEEHTVTCDFCGGDIFQSFFECRNCVQGGVSATKMLHICAGCYVEGRCCECSNMQPVQYGSFQGLVDDREKVVNIVCEYEKREGRSYQPELKLINDSVPGLFRAACCLYQKRLSAPKDSKVCNVRQGGKHDTPYHWSLSCKGCHRNHCFAHLLETSKVHAVEALLVHMTDKTPKHERYHGYHLSGRTRFRDGLPELEASQTAGTRCSGHSWLVYNAFAYSHCTPIQAKYVRYGWYDNQVFEEESEDELDTAPVSESANRVDGKQPSDKASPVEGTKLPSLKLKLSVPSHTGSSSAKQPRLSAPATFSLTPASPPPGSHVQTPNFTTPQSNHSASSDTMDIEMVDSIIRVPFDDIPLSDLTELTSDDEPLTRLLEPVRKKRKLMISSSQSKKAAKDKEETASARPSRPVVKTAIKEDDIIRRPPQMPKPFVLIPPAPYPLRPRKIVESESEVEIVEVPRPGPSTSSSKDNKAPERISFLVQGQKGKQKGKGREKGVPAAGGKRAEDLLPGPSTSSRSDPHHSSISAFSVPEQKNKKTAQQKVLEGATLPGPSKPTGKGHDRRLIPSTGGNETTSSTRPSVPSASKSKKSEDPLVTSSENYSHKVGSRTTRPGPLSKTLNRKKAHDGPAIPPSDQEHIVDAAASGSKSTLPSIKVSMPQKPTTSKVAPSRLSHPTSTSIAMGPPKRPTRNATKSDASSKPAADATSKISNNISLGKTESEPAKKSKSLASDLSAALSKASSSNSRGTVFTARSGLVGRADQRRRSDSMDVDQEDDGPSAPVTPAESSDSDTPIIKKLQKPVISSFKARVSEVEKVQSKKRPRTRASDSDATLRAEPLSVVAGGPSNLSAAAQAREKSSLDTDTTKQDPLSKLRFKRNASSSSSPPAEPSLSQQDATQTEQAHRHFLEVGVDVDCTSTPNLPQSNSEIQQLSTAMDVTPSTPPSATPSPPEVPLPVTPPLLPPPPPPEQPQPTSPTIDLSQPYPWRDIAEYMEKHYPEGPLSNAMVQMSYMLLVAGSSGMAGQQISYASQQTLPAIVSSPDRANAILSSPDHTNGSYSAHPEGTPPAPPQERPHDQTQRHRSPPEHRTYHNDHRPYRNWDQRRYGNAYSGQHNRDDRRDQGTHSHFDGNRHASQYRGNYQSSSRGRRGNYDRSPYTHRNNGYNTRGSGHMNDSYRSYDRNTSFEHERGRRSERDNNNRMNQRSDSPDRDIGQSRSRNSPARRGGEGSPSMSLLARISDPVEGGRQTPADGQPMDVDRDDANRPSDAFEHLPKKRDITRAGNGDDDDEHLDWGEDDIDGGDLLVPAPLSSPTQVLNGAPSVGVGAGPATR